MSLNDSIIIDQVERHESYVRHIFRDALSGPKSTFNSFIERTKYDWYTVTELLSVDLIQNYAEKYNNMAAST